MQKAKLSFLLFIVMMFLLGCAWVSGKELEEEPPAAIVSRELDVIEHGHNEGSMIQLFGSTELFSGDSLFVHDGGSGRLNFGDDMLLRLFNDTRLNEIRAESAEGVPLDVQMYLVEGGLTGRLTGVGGRARITTPNNAQIDIFGTEFFVIFDPTNDLAAAGNFGGTVEVSSAGQKLSVESGTFVLMPGRNPPTDPLPIGESLEEFEQRSVDLLSPIGAYVELFCEDGLEVIGDLSIPHGSVLQPGEIFVKSWQVRNTGSCSWNKDYSLQFIDGTAMSGDTAVLMDAEVNPNENLVLSITMVAPIDAGTYNGLWQLFGPQGEAIGRPLEVEIVVPERQQGTPQPTPEPSHTPPPTVEQMRTTAPILTPTMVPSLTPTITPSLTPTEEPCQRPSTVTALVDGYVRNGPGTIYDTMGTLTEGETAEVTGRDGETAYWWRIDAPHLYGDQLWIADSVVSFEGEVECVPLVYIPPTPTPTPTPMINLPPELITVDTRCTQCQELVWETAHIDALYLDGQPVPLSSRRDVCLSSSDLYELESGYQSQIVYPYLFGVDAPEWDIEQMTQVYWTLPDLWLNAKMTEIEAGACTSLEWKAGNAKVVTLDSEAVEHEGSKTICPRDPFICT